MSWQPGEPVVFQPPEQSCPHCGTTWRVGTEPLSCPECGRHPQKDSSDVEGAQS